MPVPTCRLLWLRVPEFPGLQTFLGWGGFSAKTRKDQDTARQVGHLFTDTVPEVLRGWMISHPLGGCVISEFPLIYCIFTWARHGPVWYNGPICWKFFWNQKLSKKLCNPITWEWARKQNHVNPEVPGPIRNRLFSERVNNITYIPS